MKKREKIVGNMRHYIPLCGSLGELSEKTGHSYRTLQKYAEELGMELPKGGPRRLPDGDISKRIQENFGKALSKTHLAELAGCSTTAVNSHLEILGLEFEHKSYRRGKVFLLKGNRKPNNLFNRMILEGATLEEMGEADRKTRECARQYINRRGLYDLWRSRRAKRRRGEDYQKDPNRHMRSEIVWLMKAHLLQKIEAEPLHVRKAFEYYFSMKMRGERIPIKKLIQVFEKYYKMKEDDKTLSLKELAEDTGLWHTAIGRILHKVGEKPMYWSVENMRRFTREEEEGIKRAHEMGVGSEDIGYFTGRSDDVISNKKRSLGLRGRISSLKQFGSSETKEHLTYRKASEIYLSQDLGYSKEETMELLDVSERAYDYAMENQEEIAGKIENILDVLRPESKHSRPYITSLNGDYLVKIDEESVIGFGSEEEASGYVGRVGALGIGPERVGVYRKT